MLLTLVDLSAARPMPPTVREIVEALGGRRGTNNAVRRHVLMLVRDGYVAKIPRLARAIFVTRKGRARIRELRGVA